MTSVRNSLLHLSAPEETGLCPQCGGDLTLNADATFWQCEAPACLLRGKPQVAVTEEDRETMRAVGSLDDVMHSLFGPDGPSPDVPVTFHAMTECPFCGTPVADEPSAEADWRCRNAACELSKPPPSEAERAQLPVFEGSIEDVYRTFFMPEADAEPDPERKRRWPFGRRGR